MRRTWTNTLTLHIRHLPGGVFTDHVFNTMKERDILRFEGPLGTFFLREDSAKPIVLLASGTGFAPIKAMVEQAHAQPSSTRPITLYWGGRRPGDLYMHALCEEWAATLPRLPLRAGGVGRDAGRRLAGPHRLRPPGRDAGPARPVGLPGLCLRRAGHGGGGAGATSWRAAACRPDEFYADAFTSEADLAPP